MTSLWLPPGFKTVVSSVTIDPGQFYRTFHVGVCKCGHAWIMHFHNNNPDRPGTSCDHWDCKCKHYRFRRLRRIGPRKSKCRIEDGYCLTHHSSRRKGCR